MVSSVLHEGARGLHNSQRDILKSANDIARANVRDDISSTVTPVAEETPFAPVEETRESQSSDGFGQTLVELRKQEQIFNASANVISVANQTLGSLIDVTS